MATRVETHIVSKNDSNYKVFDELTLNSRNLYNCCVYLERQFIFRNFVTDIDWLNVDVNLTSDKLSFKELYHLIRTNYAVINDIRPQRIDTIPFVDLNQSCIIDLSSIRCASILRIHTRNILLSNQRPHCVVI